MNSRRRLCRLVITVALTALAVPLPAVIGTGITAAGETGPLRVAGELPTPKGKPKHPQRPASVVAVDANSRRLYLAYTDVDLIARVVTYDLTPRIPRQIATGELGPEGDFTLATRYTVAYDSRRRQLAFITPAFDADGHSLPTGTVTVVVYSEAKGRVISKWNLARTVPGFYPMGVTYSEKDDRYYAVGEFSGQRNLADGTFVAGGKAFGPGTAVVAFDAADGAVEWARAVPECQQVLYSKDIGSLIARSAHRDALYFPCVSGGSSGGMTYPGQAGLVRLAIDPKADIRKATELPLEFFAISGSYFAGGQASGIAAFDDVTERFYLQSIAYTTPGAWVFDGQLSAWVGFVASEVNSNYFIGINEGMGHLYIGTRRGGEIEPTDGILVANVRQTPVPAGEFFNGVIPSGLMIADRKTNRLFVRPYDPNGAIVVLEDLTQVTSGDDDVDYDAGTSNTRDTPEADIFYGIGATGYAAQAVQVGGTGAPQTMFGPREPLTAPDPVPPPPAVSDDTRALMTARVGGIDLRANGASASAQSAVPDASTLREYESQSADRDGDGRRDPWPFPVGACLDAGGRPVKSSWRDDSGGTSAAYSIECDVAKKLATATVRMGSSGTGGVTVSKGEYVATATRDRVKGAAVTTSTYADGTAMELAGGYVVRFGHVASTATSRAHGTPGTTYSVWTRDVDGVRVVGPDGKTLYTAPGCASKVEGKAGRSTVTDTCQPLAKTLNKLLPTRFRIDFPLPYVATTPKGAFAGVEQTKAQYFQQVVVNDQGVVYRGDSVGIRPAPAVVTETYNDSAERSRTVTVLAATQANAVFQVNPPFKYGPGPGPGPDLPPTGDPGGETGTGSTGGALNPRGTGTDDVDGGPGANPQPQSAGNNANAIDTSLLNGFFFMRRSLVDIVLLILLSGLVLGGAGTLWRRRRLVEVLVTVPRKEAL